jgi:LEA14-like dessication related protein
MDVPPRAIKAAKVSAVVLVALVVLLGILLATGVLAAPTVQNIDKGWGEVTDNTTEIETQVRVDNPNPIGIPGIIDIEYTASLNDVVLTRNERSGIGLSPGSNTITLTSEMPNDRIADWWVTHVNNGEESTLRIDPSVSGPGFSQSLSTQTSTIETDLLSSFGGEGPETLTLDNESFLILRDQRAAWGEATAETTPLSFTTTLENVHDYSVTLDGVAYEVSMNDVTLGSGQTTDGIEVAPGERGTLTVDAALDTAAFADWWPTHVRNNETSRMDVQLYGIVEKDGERRRVPLRLYQQRLEFDTDLLGEDGTDVQSLPTQRDDLTVPTVGETDRQWGEVTESTTEVITSIGLENTSDIEKLRDVTTLSVSRTTTINDVSVVDSTTGYDLPPAGEPLTVTSEMDNDRVNEWWADHLNAGERSTISTTATTLVDVGVTRFDVPTDDRSSNLETDLLAGFNTEEDQPVEEDGQTYLVAESTSAEWGEATPQVAPMNARSVLRNEQPVPITVVKIDYTVSLNDVTLADDSHAEDTVIAPGETETVALTMALDNTKMDAWWVTHIRNGESSLLDVNATATINVAGEMRTVPLEMLSKNETVETDILSD